MSRERPLSVVRPKQFSPSAADVPTAGRPISALFRPRSVAVIGATPDKSKPAGRTLAFLAHYGFSGDIHAVNPKYDQIDGTRCYPDISAIPGPVDLIVLLVPALQIPGYLREAVAAGVQAAIICSSGFAEAGESGRALQDELVEIASASGMVILGPNCVGMINLEHDLLASFSNAFEPLPVLKRGPVALVSQSGAVGTAAFVLAQQQGVGCGKFLSTGNEASLDFADVLDYLAGDDDVSVILGYVEGLRDGRRFVDAARRAREAGKLVAIAKVGNTDAGERAASSHTGAMVGSRQVYDAAFRAAGIIGSRDIRSMVNLGLALPGHRPAKGRRVGIVSTSGGAAVMMADMCADLDLDVVRLGDETQAALAKVLPSFVGMSNPVDYGPVYSDPDAIAACVRNVARDPTIDVVLFFLGMSPGMAGVIEHRIAAVQEETSKPIVAVWLAGPAQGIVRMRELDLAAYPDIADAVQIASHLAEAGTELPTYRTVSSNAARAAATRRSLGELKARKRFNLSERDTRELLKPYGLFGSATVYATTEQEAEAAVRSFKRKVAVKADADDLLHKSDAGAVRLNVSSETVAEAFRSVVAGATEAVGEARVRGALIEPMAEPGLEILAGLRFDPQFGPTVSVGLGGVASEALADVTTELAPIDRQTALAMLGRLAGRKLFGAFRGTPPRDTAALADVLVALSEFAADAGTLVSELDLNPIIVHASGFGCTIVDAAAVLAKDEG